MDILGVVPARGGSSGVVKKSIAPLAGRPLLAYTAEAVRSSRRLTRTVLTTDDEGIARVGEQCGLEVPFMRPSELAADDTPILEVLQHVVRSLDEREGYAPAYVVLLQPTSPLRRAEHIDAAIEMVLQTGADSVVSVVKVPHQFTPVSVLRFEDGRLRPYGDEPSVTRRQDKPTLYARNGPAVLVTRTTALIEGGSLYGEDSRPLIMDAQTSVDVDTVWELELAEFLLSTRGMSTTEP